MQSLVHIVRRGSGDRTNATAPRLTPAVLVLGFVILLSQVTAVKVEGAPPINPDLQNQLNSVQSTVNGVVS